MDSATLRDAYDRGAKDFWLHYALQDVQKAAHEAGVREVLRVLDRFEACVPEPIAFSDRLPDPEHKPWLGRPHPHDPILWQWRTGPGMWMATHWLPHDTPCLPTRRVVT